MSQHPDDPADQIPELSRLTPLAPTTRDVIGPYYRKHAPIRAKVSPPLAPGDTLVIAGRVWGLDTRKPLPNSIIELWQADKDGVYDNEDKTRPPPRGSFHYRTTVITDEHGRYEFETIYPGPYQIQPSGVWRSPHIHYRVHAEGHKELTTQLFFAGAPYLDTDPFCKPSLIIPLTDATAPNGGKYKYGEFEIVLVAST